MTLLEPAPSITDTTTAAKPAVPAAAPAPVTDPAPTHRRLEHPAFGRAQQATVSPISMTLYRVSLDGAVLGYLEAAGPIWVALRGDLYPNAVEIAQNRLFATALRALTT